MEEKEDAPGSALLRLWPILFSIGAVLLAVGVFQTIVTENTKDIEEIHEDFRTARATMLSIENRVSATESVDVLQNERLARIAVDTEERTRRRDSDFAWTNANVNEVRKILGALESRVSDLQTVQVRLMDRVDRIERPTDRR